MTAAWIEYKSHKLGTIKYDVHDLSMIFTSANNPVLEGKGEQSSDISQRNKTGTDKYHTGALIWCGTYQYYIFYRCPSSWRSMTSFTTRRMLAMPLQTGKTRAGRSLLWGGEIKLLIAFFDSIQTQTDKLLWIKLDQVELAGPKGVDIEAAADLGQVPDPAPPHQPSDQTTYILFAAPPLWTQKWLMWMLCICHLLPLRKQQDTEHIVYGLNEVAKVSCQGTSIYCDKHTYSKRGKWISQDKPWHKWEKSVLKNRAM